MLAFAPLRYRRGMASLDPVVVARVHELAQRTHEYDERTWETVEIDALLTGVLPQLRDLANDAIAAFGAALEAGDCHSGDFDNQTEQSKVADIAFMGRWDLQRRAQELDRAVAQRDPRDRWVLLARACSLRRGLLTALCEFERARCAIDGAPFRFAAQCSSRRELAVATRQAYRRFIARTRTIAAGLEAGLLELSAGLRLAAAAIAALIGEDVYPALRIEDREALRRLQARLFAAVREGDEFFARRVWADLAGFAELLGAVNRRHELVVHDYELACEALARLAALGPDEALAQGWRTRLRALAGRDAELDARLDELDTPSARVRLAPALFELADELGRTLGRDVHLALGPALDAPRLLAHGPPDPSARPN